MLRGGNLVILTAEAAEGCSGEGPPKTDLLAFSPSLPPVLGSAEEPCQRERQVENLKETEMLLPKPITVLSAEKRIEREAAF
ncbi:hypothetical protein U0070_027251 [Myodes glareolus]|uniref:Uncharacterized protein n=1 Tax=Myodes glareolus TaxID=447135 RepID=A0AAW0HF73_MYOGA